MVSPRTTSGYAVPVYIVTGRGGCGKSHFIRQCIHSLRDSDSNIRPILIRHRHAKGAMLETFRRPLTIQKSLEEDEKSLSKNTNGLSDADYAVWHFSEVFDFGSGCICCAPDGDLIRQLVDLKSAIDSEIVQDEHFRAVLLLETTGLADPRPFLRVFTQETEVLKRFTLNGVICIIDGLRINVYDESAESRICDDGATTLVDRNGEQIRASDLILVNHSRKKSFGVADYRLPPSIKKHLKSTDVQVEVDPESVRFTFHSRRPGDVANGGKLFLPNFYDNERLQPISCGRTECEKNQSPGDGAMGVNLFRTPFSTAFSRGHDLTFQTACLCDSTVLNFQRNLTLMEMMLAEGRIERIQGWIGLENKLTTGENIVSLLSQLIPPLLLIDASGPYPARIHVEAIDPLSTNPTRYPPVWDALFGGCLDSIAEKGGIAIATKLFFCGKAPPGAGSASALEHELRKEISTAVENGVSDPAQWSYYDLETMFAKEIQVIRDILNANDYSTAGGDVETAGSTTIEKEKSKAFAYSKRAVQAISADFKNRIKGFEVGLESNCMLTYDACNDSLTISSDSKPLSPGTDWKIAGTGLWVRIG